jgi:hypothetical protein
MPEDGKYGVRSVARAVTHDANKAMVASGVLGAGANRLPSRNDPPDSDNAARYALVSPDPAISGVYGPRRQRCLGGQSDDRAHGPIASGGDRGILAVPIVANLADACGCSLSYGRVDRSRLLRDVYSYHRHRPLAIDTVLGHYRKSQAPGAVGRCAASCSGCGRQRSLSSSPWPFVAGFAVVADAFLRRHKFCFTFAVGDYAGLWGARSR